jgi:hypothetical protein
MWKTINDYEDYQVSDWGYIKNKRGLITRGWSHNKYGHRKVRLYKDDKAKDFYLHRLVAIAFIDNPDNKPYINHIDSNPDNNHYTNLEWVTHKENVNHARINGRLNTVGKRLMSTVTGKVYKSVFEASKDYGIKHNTLVYKLLGKRKNDTDLVVI